MGLSILRRTACLMWLTVDVVVPCILQASVNQLLGSREELALVNVTSESVPRVPAQSWEFALLKLANVYIGVGKLTVWPSGMT